MEKGLVCGLTEEKMTDTNQCENYEADEAAIKTLEMEKKAAAESDTGEVNRGASKIFSPYSDSSGFVLWIGLYFLLDLFFGGEFPSFWIVLFIVLGISFAVRLIFRKQHLYIARCKQISIGELVYQNDYENYKKVFKREFLIELFLTIYLIIATFTEVISLNVAIAFFFGYIALGCCKDAIYWGNVYFSIKRAGKIIMPENEVDRQLIEEYLQERQTKSIDEITPDPKTGDKVYKFVKTAVFVLSIALGSVLFFIGLADIFSDEIKDIMAGITLAIYGGLAFSYGISDFVKLLHGEIYIPTYRHGGALAEEAQPEEITAKYLKRTTSIGGWLGLFLFTTIYGAIRSALNLASEFDFALMAIYAIYFLQAGITIISFSERQKDAVHLGMLTIFYRIVDSILTCLVLYSLYKGALVEELYYTITLIICSVALLINILWSLYLILSKKVKRAIPKSYRKASLRFYILLACLIVSLAIYGSYCAKRINEAKSEQVTTQTELTWERPFGYSCKELPTEVEGMRLYEFTDYSNTSFYISYLYDKHQYDEKEFLIIYDKYEPDEDKEYPKAVMSNEPISINGLEGWQAIVRYNLDGTYVYKNFVLLTDRSNHQAIVAWQYLPNEDFEVFEEFLETLKFQQVNSK